MIVHRCAAVSYTHLDVYKRQPLEHLDQLSEQDILRTIAFFRYINPEANIRLAAGRALLTNDGETAFKSGASATITGNTVSYTHLDVYKRQAHRILGL